MKKHYLSSLLVFCFAAVAAECQQTTPVLQQPTVKDYALKVGVKEVVIQRQAVGGNDLASVETLCFDSVGRLTSLRKSGFGGNKVTSYPVDNGQFEVVDTVERATYLFAMNSKTEQNYMLRRTLRAVDGDVVAVYHYNDNGFIERSVHYIYAASGALATTVQYDYGDAGGVAGRRLSSYSKSGKVLTMQSYSADEQLLMEETYTYDKQDNPVKRVQKFYDNPSGKPRETVETRRYTYDSHGNWTTQQYSLAGRQLYTYSRTIKYY